MAFQASLPAGQRTITAPSCQCRAQGSEREEMEALTQREPRSWSDHISRSKGKGEESGRARGRGRVSARSVYPGCLQGLWLLLSWGDRILAADSRSFRCGQMLALWWIAVFLSFPPSLCLSECPWCWMPLALNHPSRWLGCKNKPRSMRR